MNNFIDFNKLKEWIENVDLDKCKNYIILNPRLRTNEFSEIDPNFVYDYLQLGIKLYLLDEFDNVFSFYSYYENRKSKSSPEFLWNLKTIKYAIDKAAEPILIKIMNLPFEQVRGLVYNIDLDKCEEHAIKYCKNERIEDLICFEKKDEIVNENYFSEDGVYDYLMINYFKKIREIHTQNLPFITEFDEENYHMERLFEILVEASKTITKALKTSFNLENY